MLQTVPKIGKKGEIISVSDGYAKNALFPKGLAQIATDGAIRKFEEQKAREEREAAEREKAAKALVADMQKHVFQFYVKAGKNGELFSSLHQDAICEALTQFAHEHNPIFGAQDIHCETKPIKELGEKKLQVKIGRGEHMHPASVTLSIVPQNP
jgi:large subunit ribosomal protein L9